MQNAQNKNCFIIYLLDGCCIQDQLQKDQQHLAKEQALISSIIVCALEMNLTLRYARTMKLVLVTVDPEGMLV